MLIKYSWIVANYHKWFLPNNKLVIRAMWMPGMPRNSNDNDFDSLLSIGYDVVIPEYYGSFRSDWEFTPENCYKTLLETKKTFSNGNIYDIFGKKDIYVNYKTIDFIGESFGGYFISRLAFYDQTIDRLALLYPTLAFDNYGKIWSPEQTPEDVNYILENWLKYFYRWYDEENRRKLFEDKYDYNLSQTINSLKDKKIFLAHWEEDKVINISRSDNFYENFTSNSENIYIKIPKVWHWPSTKTIALPELCKRLSKTK